MTDARPKRDQPAGADVGSAHSAAELVFARFWAHNVLVGQGRPTRSGRETGIQARRRDTLRQGRYRRLGSTRCELPNTRDQHIREMYAPGNRAPDRHAFAQRGPPGHRRFSYPKTPGSSVPDALTAPPHPRQASPRSPYAPRPGHDGDGLASSGTPRAGRVHGQSAVLPHRLQCHRDKRRASGRPGRPHQADAAARRQAAIEGASQQHSQGLQGRLLDMPTGWQRNSKEAERFRLIQEGGRTALGGGEGVCSGSLRPGLAEVKLRASKAIQGRASRAPVVKPRSEGAEPDGAESAKPLGWSSRSRDAGPAEGYAPDEVTVER
jgi:hypothetical protein